VYGSLGQDDKCLRYYRELQRSRQYFVDYVFSYASEDQKMSYVEKYPLLDHSFISFAIETNSDDSRNSVLEMVLKGKAAVIDAISAEREFAYCSYDEGIQVKARKHAEICGEISTLTLVGAKELDPEIYRNRLGALYAVKDSLEADLSATCSEFNEELTASRFTVTDVASALPQRASLWEFVRYEPYDFGKVGSDDERAGPARYVVFTLDHAGNTTLTDLGDAAEIDSLVALTRELIYRSRSEVFSPLAAESEKRVNLVAGKLYDIIFGPLVSTLDAGTDIFISPDGQLSLLPFEIFPCPDGKYVIERFRISYLSSGRDLLKFSQMPEFGNWALAMADPDFNLFEQPLDRLRDETLPKSDAVSFSVEPFRGVSECFNSQFNPLPHSRVEAISIAETLKSKAHLRTESYFGADALEGVLKAMVSAPRVLHLATHGYFCEDIGFTTHRLLENPLLRSGLALSGANRLRDRADKVAGRVDDGVLTAFEVSGLNLNGAELVVLSACESGVGQVTNGEGVYGLRRAFQCAGARTVVMSLWKVPDKETGDMMCTFYDKWLSGLTKKEALRQSALGILNACRAKNGIAHPLFWGGFVLVGQPD
jgi:CHAT domain-containing protein